MPSAAYNPTLKLKTNSGSLKRLGIKLMTGNCKLKTVFIAAADSYCTAAVIGECFAAFVSFRWQPTILPPDNSATEGSPVGGNYTLYDRWG